MRNHVVQKMTTVLTQIADTGAVRDTCIINLSDYARRTENQIFEIVNNREEYFYKLAEKINKIQKELEGRQEKKRLESMDLVAKMSSSTGETSSHIDSTSKQLPKHPIQFTLEELRIHLEPVIQTTIACDNSHPFR